MPLKEVNNIKLNDNTEDNSNKKDNIEDHFDNKSEKKLSVDFKLDENNVDISEKDSNENKKSNKNDESDKIKSSINQVDEI